MKRWLVVVYEEGGFRAEERMYWFDTEPAARQFIQKPEIASLAKWDRVQLYCAETVTL